ncbi:hypothetical protein [Symbiopectobacterium purcellii]|uniref:hypothetical protein n=1 Tax=Symbiopectobacterium purcellii TaxID=2871826 RepID=UPI003F85E1C9
MLNYSTKPQQSHPTYDLQGLLFGLDIANRLKNDYSRCPDMWQRSIAGCYQNNVA